MAIARKARLCVWRWQERFMQEGADGLLRGRTHSFGKRPVASGTDGEIVWLAQVPSSHEATRQTVRFVASTVWRTCNR